MELLGYDQADALELLASCCAEELHKHEECQRHKNHWVYIFIVEPGADLPLYLKVALNVVTMKSAILMSFKLDGSPA